MLAKALLVEDDKEYWQPELERYLKLAGCDVKKVVDAESAKRMLGKEFYSVIVVDLQLENLEYPNNRDGMEVVAEVSRTYGGSATTIIVTVHGEDVSLYKKALKDYHVEASHFLIKGDFDPEEFLVQVKEALGNMGMGPTLDVNPTTGIPMASLVPLISDEVPGESAYEIEAVFRALFAGIATSFTVTEVLREGFGGAGIVKVTGTGPAGMQVDKVVKFGARKVIEKEAANYDKFVRDYQHRRVDMVGPVYGSRIAALKYTFLASAHGLTSLHSLFQTTQDSGKIERTLNHLFRETCGHWHDNRTPKAILCPYEEYFEDRSAVEKARAGFSRVAPHLASSERMDFPGVAEGLLNPFLYLEEFAGKRARSHKCITHGDLTGRNVFVHPQKEETWLIDFYLTGPSHYLRDFVKLETSLRFESLRYDVPGNLGALREFERALVAPDSFEDHLPPPLQAETDKELEKLYVTVRTLRELAGRLTFSRYDLGLVDYYLVLFYRTLKSIGYKSICLDRKPYMAMFASLLGEKIASLVL